MYNSLTVPCSNNLPYSTLKNLFLPVRTKVFLVGLSLINRFCKCICSFGRQLSSSLYHQRWLCLFFWDAIYGYKQYNANRLEVNIRKKQDFMRLMKAIFEHYSNHTNSQLKSEMEKICKDYDSVGKPKENNLNIKELEKPLEKLKELLWIFLQKRHLFKSMLES